MKPLILLLLLLLLPSSALRATTQINAGDSFYLVFDTTPSGAPPPYSVFVPTLFLDGSDPIDPGDGMTAQLFDLFGTALASPKVALWSGSSSGSFGLDVVDYWNPSPAAQGVIQFSDVVGSFALANGHRVEGISYYPVTSGVSTDFVPATLGFGFFRDWSAPASVPENLTTLPWLASALAGAVILRLRSRKYEQSRTR